MNAPRSGLGRGLASLLPDAAGAAPGSALQVAVDLVRPNPYQPRRDFDESALADLVASIRQHGVVQPITLREAPDGQGYQLIAGERRLRAAKLAGLPTIPAVVRPCNERELIEIALIENLQREDINGIEAAVAYRRCLDDFSLTQDELAERLGKSRTTIANTLRLLKLPPALQQAIAEGRLSEGHGRALLSLADCHAQAAVAERIMAEQLSVREAEALCREPQAAGRRSAAAAKAGAAVDPDVAVFENLMQRALGTKVEIRAGRGGAGTVVVHFYNQEDLERIAEALGA
ncbi:MAG: ParB/RepB/Spo0J family partition protein [Armatimonadetes bacterium]|nr:ParB/RepB/Spo0J family partition protein [Armatimonadota bacterium]